MAARGYEFYLRVLKVSLTSDEISEEPAARLDKPNKLLHFASWFPTLISCSPNLPRVYIRLCKHGNHFTFLQRNNLTKGNLFNA